MIENPIVIQIVVGAVCSVGFILTRRVAGACGHSDQWWYGWASGILALSVGLGVLFETLRP